MLTQFCKKINKLQIQNILILLLLLSSIILFFYHIITDAYLIASILGFVILFFLSRMMDGKSIDLANKHFRHFTKINKTATFKETMPRFNEPRAKVKHAILLLHGFSASTSEFNCLYPELDKRGILYYAPALSGFGADSIRELKNISAEQWLRDGEKGYLLLSRMAEEISIIAHSMGSLIALHLSGKYPVKKLVLTSPYIQYKMEHRTFASIMRYPALCKILMFLNPIVKKNSKQDLEEVALSGRFVYVAVPIQAVKELWRLTELIEYNNVKQNNMVVLFGNKDYTIEIERTLDKLRKINEGLESLTFEKSGHNLLEDVESEQVRDMIIENIFNKHHSPY